MVYIRMCRKITLLAVFLFLPWVGKVEAAAKLPLLKNGVYICMVWYGLYCPRKRLDQLKK